jgi:hypothetical protein
MKPCGGGGKMIAFTFTFAKDPGGNNEPLRISMIAQNQEDAWQRIAQELSIPIDKLKEYSPTIQMKELTTGEIIISRSRTLTNPDDPWPQIVSEGIRDVSDAIRDTVGSARKDRIQVDLAKIGIDRLIISVFSAAFLGALLFSFYLIVAGNQDAVSRFIFPIITAVIGLISGYFAGRGSAEGTRR